MHLPHVAALIMLAPQWVHAQRLEMSWAFGTSVATQPVVRSGGNVGRLRPALLAEVAAHYVDAHTRRLGMIVQVVPFPGMRVTGHDLEGNAASRTFGMTPNLVLRLLADASPWRTRGLAAPSFGLGYSSFIFPASGCVSGNDSPLCFTAVESTARAESPVKGHDTWVVGLPTLGSHPLSRYARS
jgi:hypothetical protein